MQIITSTKNPIIQRLAQLKTKKGRDEQGLYLIEGTRLVREAMLHHEKFAVLAKSGDEGGLEGVVQYAQSTGSALYTVPSHVMAHICDTEQPQGIAAAVRLPKEAEIKGDCLLALDRISDPGNLGTMLRSAVAFGVTDVLLSQGCADAFAPKCVRSGMGAHFRLNIREKLNLAEVLHTLGNEDYVVIGASVLGCEKFQKKGSKCVYVIGNEANGLSMEVEKACTELYRIPMAEGSESLNAAVAAGILLFLGFSGQNEA